MSLARIRSVGRLAVLAFLALLLLIPLFMVRNLVSERQDRAKEVREEIASKWGKEQTLQAPILSVPWVKRTVLKNGKVEVEERWTRLFPEVLAVDVDIATQVRRRSLFEVPLYTAAVECKGTWSQARAVAPTGEGWIAQWSRAVVSLHPGDARSLARKPLLEIGGRPLEVSTSAPEGGVGNFLLHARTDALQQTSEPISFRFQFVQRGSDMLAVAPQAGSTDVRIRSDWKSPSFQGSFLPDEWSNSPTGFDASWHVSGLNMSIPMSWFDDDAPAVMDATRETPRYSSDESSSSSAAVLAVSLVEPVEGYDSVDRSMKYGLLVVALSFVALFLFEAFLSKPLHPVQYGLIGLSLALFYLMLLSISEHIGFEWAYAIASSAVTGLVAGYASAVLAGWRRGALLGAGLVALWGFLFTLLKAEDWSLLMGSTGLFLILALVMWLTRRIDWNRRDAEDAAHA